MLVDALIFGLAIGFMFLGLIGTIIPILPGIFLIWFSVFVYAFIEKFQAIDPLTFIAITIITLAAGTSDIWLSNLGASRGGASKRSLLYGSLGSIIGLIVLGIVIPVIGGLIGSVVGYMVGVILSEYRQHGDWQPAIKASLGGLAGWGLATGVQFGGGILIMALFVWQVLKF